MFRFIINKLDQWLSEGERKPLILRGARQVGKTWVVRELAKMNGRQLVELNFERNPEYVSFFNTSDVAQVILQIEASFKVTIDADRCIIFLDEIQAAPELLAKLRWFAEEAPQLPIIAAGSLLEFALKNFEYSMPVGRVSYMYLEPLSFEEYLLATDNDKALAFLQQYDMTQPIAEALHRQLMQLIKEYLIIGGLPAAVVSWCQHKSLEKVNQKHFDLLTTYRDDFSKYTKNVDTEYLNDVLTAIPGMLGGKFVYRNVSNEVRSEVIKKAFELLACARIIHPVYATSGNGLPLQAEVNKKYFKSILLDVGISGTLLGLNLAQINNVEDINLINKGGIAEQFIGQQLRCLQPCYISPELYYWTRTKSNASAEVDYLIQHKEHVIPVEVKSGKTGTLKSLHAFMAAKQLRRALRINSDKPSKVRVDVSLTTGEPVQYELVSLPFYLVGQVTRLSDESLK